MKIRPLVFLIAALGFANSTLAQETSQSFVNKAAQAGMCEVELGALASKKGQSPDVKKFGERMVTDHTKTGVELDVLAKAKGLQVPKRLDAEHQAMIDMLNGKSGAEFDASYAEHMATAHTKAIALFEGASRSTDSDVAAFAKQTLATLREHKQMADNLGANTGKAK
jgi:putative membrane protein